MTPEDRVDPPQEHYDRATPIFTRPEADSAPHGGEPAGRPAVESNTIAALLARITGSDREPTKVDVNGSVQGTAEIHATTTMTVEPSPYFAGLVKSMEHVAELNLSGKIGGTMEGSNGARPGVNSSIVGHH